MDILAAAHPTTTLVLDPAGSTNGTTGEFRTLTLAYRWVKDGAPYYTFGSLILTSRK